MSKKTRIGIVIVALLIVAFFVYQYLYQDHRDIQNEEAQTTITASDLLITFQSNEGNQLLNQTLIVEGTVTETNSDGITLDKVVSCNFENLMEGVAVGDVLSIKGRCIGYDDLFDMVKLDQCAINN